MASTPLKFGLFTRMLALCILVAGLSAALVTVAFYSYRTAVTTNRLATELSAQSYATAPVVAASLADGNAAGAARLLRVFGGLNYVTCVDIVNDGLSGLVSSVSRAACGTSSPRHSCGDHFHHSTPQSLRSHSPER